MPLSVSQQDSLFSLYQEELRHPQSDHLNPRFIRPGEAPLRRHPGMARHLENYPVTALAPGPRTWIWSDLHLGHEAIMEYSGRPFQSAAHMAEALFAAWAGTVGPEDRLVIAGDVCMSGALNEVVFNRLRGMPGRKLLVPGNHDLTGAGHLRPEGLDEVHAMLYQLGAPGEPNLLITHLPVFDLPEGWINIHGHWHEKNADGARHINVSVEQLNYRPVDFELVRGLACRLHAGASPQGTTQQRIGISNPAPAPAAKEASL